MRRAAIDGMQFGRLKVLGYSQADKNGNAIWLCRCDCGKETLARGDCLKSGKTRSCGCLRDDIQKKKKTTHGLCRSRLARIWYGMKKRCLCPTSSVYKNYGGRGIAICEEWRNSFPAFYEWAMANGYRNDLSIDRVNNDGNYEPSNCRWATAKEQNNNRRPRQKRGV